MTKFLEGKESEGKLTVRIKEPCTAAGAPRAIGDIVECGTLDAMYLVHLGRAEHYITAPILGVKF
jgi:hypothetical protein